ncbi:PAS domain-containing sensor histidine kinase [Allomuricauda sp. SCSIO 65647]|uniref:sensor histidine kinase n=1 Tax=Allomuricauda sp. SCSIO 65647 TaxID=2908843 RepID=UPI001F3C2F44|nr:PAS domain-containing sensor histidine kinase [Muricauda sp. SCSIO 65647]UJH66083.1 PAS domain-containing protein [Muricauda sp. SCSIO 65647]
MKNFIWAEKKEELIDKAFNMARVGYWEVNLIDNAVTWSEMTKAIHKVPTTYIPNLEDSINFYKDGKDRETITNVVNNAIETGEPWDVELIIITAEEDELWVRAQGEVEFENDMPIRLFGTFQDIDQKKRSELRYNEAMERLALATKTAKVGIWDFDVVNNTLIWDDNMFALYGIKRKDFAGAFEAWEASIHPEDKQRNQEEVAMALSGKKDFDTEFRIVKPTGEVRYIKASASVKRDKKGSPLKMVGTNWDITELKTTQLALQRSDESFVGAFQNSSIGMALVGLDGKWIDVNQSICDSVGYTKEELMQLTFQDITHPEDLEKDLRLLNELINGKRETYQIEKRYHHKEGHLVYVLLTVTGGYDINGNLSHFISQIVDISSRIDAVQKQRKLNEITLEQNKNLMNFAHIVSHNLRSHATNMSMLIAFLSKVENASETEKIMAMLASASSGLNETVDHLNEMVQIKTTALENLKPMNLLEAIKKTKNHIRAEIDKKDTEINISVSKDHYVSAVPAYLDSILLNLFTNALKYSSPERKPVLKLTSRMHEDCIILKFSDNGIGIDLERHGDKIFGMFKTFHKHKDAKGIGLFITKNQIEAMGGSISVESRPNIGTAFTLTFGKAKKP